MFCKFELEGITIYGSIALINSVYGYKNREPLIEVGPKGELALIIIGTIVLAAAVIFLCVYCCYKILSDTTLTQNQTTEDETTAAAGTAGPNATGPVTASVTRITSEVHNNKTPKTEPAIFSTEELKKVQIPHKISELEEMALYQQDQKWLEEVKQVGGKAWRAKMSLEYQHDLQGKKNAKRFLSAYNHTFGGYNLCNSCSDRLHEKAEWFRCRDCVDVDFCAKCFGYGPTIPAYGHVPCHESAKILVQEMCFICKGLISNTKFKCDDCHHVFFCLGCFMTGKHLEGHREHPITRIMATSYVMMKPEDIPSESSPLLPHREQKNEPSPPSTFTRTYVVTSDGACNSPMRSLPLDPPPSYEECTTE